jgi:hypothetical protein
MNDDRQAQLRLQIDLLRARGGLERAETALALAELRSGTRGVRHLAATAARAGGVAATLRSQAPHWLRMLAPLLLKQPAAMATGLVVVGWLRRHPWLAAVGVIGVVAGGWLVREQPRSAGARPVDLP